MRGCSRPRRRRHGGRQQEHDQDHRRRPDRPRAGVLRLRLEVGGETVSHHALRPRAHPAPPTSSAERPSSAAISGRSSSDRRPRAGRCRGATFLLNAPQPRRGLGPAPARGPAGHRPREDRVLRDRRSRVAPARHRHRPHRTRSCRLLLRALRRASREGHRPIKAPIEKTTRRKGRLRSSPPNFAAVDARSRPTASRVPAWSEQTRGAPPWSSRPPDFVATSPPYDRGEGRRAAGERLPIDGTGPGARKPVGEAQHRAGHPGLGEDALHPVRQVRDGLPARGDPRRGVRRRGSTARRHPSRAPSRARGSRGQYTIQVAPRTARAATSASRSAPRAKDKVQSQPNRHRDGRHEAPVLDAERARTSSSSWAPRVDRVDFSTVRIKSQFLEPLFEFSGACAGCGETRTSSCSTQLFGDRW